MMPDREKVIKGLECCTRYEVGKQLNNCLECPYIEPIGFNQFRCKSQEMKEDALALLKEHDAVIRCKDCKYWNHLINDRGYCSNFAQCYDGELCTDDDWFCADGEKDGDGK